MKLTKIGAGFYQVSLPSKFYSNLTLARGKWSADIRDPQGQLVRYAGIWPTRKAAVEEVLFILRNDGRPS